MSLPTSPLVCPSCGYDVRPRLESLKRIATQLKSTVATIRCDQCDTWHGYDSGISAEGVKVDGLVWAGGLDLARGSDK